LDNRITRRVKHHGYQLCSYSGLNLHDVLCAPVKNKNGSENSPLGNFRRVALKRDLYDIIKRVHCEETQHSGIRKTYDWIKTHYSNIPREAIGQVLKLCTTCSLKSTQNRNAPLQPIISKGFLERTQVDLIDMQTSPDGDYRWICHVVDHFSKYHIVFPLKRKTGEEVAHGLKRYVFSYFGLPYILQCDNGREFVNKIFEETIEIWPGTAKIIHDFIKSATFSR